MKTLTFNGVSKPWIYLQEGREKAPFAALRRNIVQMPGVPGARLQSTDTDPFVINQPVGFIVNDDQDALSKKDELASWLRTKKEVTLELSDEPGRTYYAVVQNTLEDFSRFVDQRKGTIQFLCLDPHSYGASITEPVTDGMLLLNEGTAPAYPEFTFDVTEDLTQFSLTNESIQNSRGESPSMMVGFPQAIDQQKFVREELIFQDGMSDTSSWTTATEVDNGYITGEMGVDSEGFYPSKVGEEVLPNNWQGPSLMKGIGQSLQDFRIDILLHLENIGNDTTGIFDFYARDANGNVVGKIGLGDAWAGKQENFGFVQLGDYSNGFKRNANPDYPYGWNNFDGMLRMEREQGKWMFYFAIIRSDGTHDWRRWIPYPDNEGNYTAPITDIQVYTRLWPLTDKAGMHIKGIKIYKLNQPNQTTEIPIIARAGDKLTVNMKNAQVRRNGELLTSLSPFSTAFPLNPGYNTLRIATNGSMSGSMTYRNTYY